MGQTLDIDYNHSYNTVSLNHNGNYEPVIAQWVNSRPVERT